MPSDRVSRSDSALSALAFAANIARDASEGVPIVNQILGVAARILTLVEQVDNDCASLRALAESSLALAHRIDEVLTGRTPGEQLGKSLDRALSVLRSTEELARCYLKKGRVRRALSRAFSLPRHAQRLAEDVADAVKEVLLVASLETNIRVHENLRHSDGFRLLHHYEVDKLEPFFEVASADGRITVRYHKARVDGQLLAVRYSDSGTSACKVALSQERMLEALATVQKSHPNIARLYGKGTDGTFAVIRSGFLPFKHVYATRSLTTGEVVRTALRLLDAMCHLQRHGIAWRPHHVTDFLLDDRGEPTIGLLQDLQDLSKAPDILRDQLQPANAANLFCRALVRTSHPSIDSRIDWLLEAGARVSGESIQLSVVDCSARSAVCRETIAHLRGRKTAHNPQLWMWTRVFLALATDVPRHDVKTTQIEYSAGVNGFSDTLRVMQAVNGREYVRYETYTVSIPESARGRAREAFEFPLSEPNAPPCGDTHIRCDIASLPVARAQT